MIIYLMVEHTRLTNVSFMSSRLHSRIPSIYARSFSCLYKVTHAQCHNCKRSQHNSCPSHQEARGPHCACVFLVFAAYWSDKGNYDFRRERKLYFIIRYIHEQETTIRPMLYLVQLELHYRRYTLSPSLMRSCKGGIRSEVASQG